MGAQSMLEQLLKSGLSALDGSVPGRAGRSDDGWGTFGAGAATGGVLGLLLGSRRGRSYGGKALKYGSVAALGALAYRAYTSWQEQQARQAAAPAGSTAALTPSTPRTLDRLAAPDAEQHSQAVLKAMIAAAKSDGHLDDRERGLVQAEVERAGTDPALRNWFEAELGRPLDPAEVAQAATTPELASQMYLASLLVTDETSFMERAYLDELARQLRLPPGLKDELEAQARAA